MSKRDEWAEYERARKGYLKLHVTAETVAEALAGFPLPLHVSCEWLADAVRRAVPSPDPFAWDSCEALTKGIPNRTTARNAWDEVADSLAAAFKVILANEDELSFNISEDDKEHMAAARAAMGDLLDVARRRKAMETEPRKFRSTAAMQLRVEQGFALSVIFKRAFRTDAEMQNGELNATGPWPNFYRRMMALGFDMRLTQQDAHVLDQVAEMIRELRAKFGPDGEELFVSGIPIE